MFTDKDLLKKQVEETAEHLADKIEEFEKRITSDLKTVSPAHQIRLHPLPAVGAAALAGFATLYWYPKMRPIVARLAKEYDHEITLAKNRGARFLLEILTEALDVSKKDVAAAVGE